MPRRRLLLIILLLVVSLLVVAEGVRYYASTQLVGGLAKVYGGQVEADRATAGYWRSTLEGVRIYEADGRHVLLEIKRLTLGLTLWDLVVGRTVPHQLILGQPRLVLRLDRDGKLLTEAVASQSSGVLPTEIDLQDAALAIDQEHRDRFEVGGANGTITSDGDQLNVALDMDNQRWDSWEVRGTTNASFKQGNLSASGKAIPVSPELMRRLPMLPANITDQLAFDGLVDTEIHLHFPTDNQPAFTAQASTRKASAALPALGIEMEAVAAKIDLNEKEVKLEEFQANVAGGSIHASGDFDLTKESLDLNLKLSAEKLDIARLPAAASLPEDTSGRLSGEATLKVALTNATAVQVRGDGHARIDNPVLAGVAVDPVEIKLEAGKFDAGQRGAAAGSLSFDVKLRDADLTTLLSRLQKFTKASPSQELAGSISTDLHVVLPLATINDMATYRVSGQLRDSSMRWHQLALGEVSSNISYSSGKLNLENIAGTVTTEGEDFGKVDGAVAVDLAPLGVLNAKLSVDHVSSTSLARFARVDAAPQGIASVQLDASVPLDSIGDIFRWRGAARVEIPHLLYEGREVHDVSAVAQLKNGVLRVTDLTARILDQQVAGKARVDLQQPYDFTASFDLPRVDLSDLLSRAHIKLDEPVAAGASVTGNIEGSLQPLDWKAAGSATVTNLHVRQWTAEQTSFAWAIDPQRLALSELKADIFGGVVEAKATVPLIKGQPLEISGDVARIEIDRVLDELGDFPIATKGTVSGHFDASGTDFDDLTGQLDLATDQLRLRGVASHGAKLHATVKRGIVDYQASGEVLGGQLAADGKFALGKNPARGLSGSGHASLKQVPLQAAAELLNARQRLPIEGEADLTLDYNLADLQHGPTGHGKLVLSDVSWERKNVARRLESDVVLAHNELRLEDVSAQLGGGDLTASAALPLDGRSQGEFRLGLSRVPSDRLLVLWPELQEEIDATIDAELHGTLGHRVAGGGAVSASKAQVAGVDMSGVRLPVQFLYTPDSVRGELKIQESTIQAAHGRIRGKATIVYDRVFAVSGKAQLTDLRLSSLSPSSGSLGGLSSGRISGTTTFSSNNFRSLGDLTADFNLTFAQAQASQFPVFSNISRYVLPTVPSSTSFQKGKLVGRLHGSVADIEQFALTGSDSRILADGTVSLGGRINLNVVASTGGDPLSRGIVRRVVVPIIEAETVPLALLTRANTVMADQLVYLRVGGTIHSPTVQVRAAPQLGYEALRFFITGAVGGL